MPSFERRTSDDEPDQQAETTAASLKYGFFKKRIDKRTARRDARSGLPACSRQPVPTPAVEELFAKFVTLIAAEQKRWDQEVAPLRRTVAGLTANIRTIKEDLHRAQEQLDSWRNPTTYETANNALAAWRLKFAFRTEEDALEETRRRLGHAQARLEQFTADIASRYNQHLDRQKLIVGHIWLRIATYRTELIRAHPHGDRLSTVIKWGPTELAHALDISNELGQKLIELSQPRTAIEPPEKDRRE